MENSLLFWYPKLKTVNGLLLPRTEIIELKCKGLEIQKVCDGDFSPLDWQWTDILKKARKIGFPLFLRTDELSAKHDWVDSCYVESERDLRAHIAFLVEESAMADICGIAVRALVFREFIQMRTLFKAFKGMPVNPEIRVFFNDNKVVCWHWYWIEDAIEKGYHSQPLPENWKALMKEQMDLIKESGELDDLLRQAGLVAERFDGYWSVDFCKAGDGRFYLIDMAMASMSWHPDDCDKKLKVPYGEDVIPPEEVA
jgi:hypothetical protein